MGRKPHFNKKNKKVVYKKSILYQNKDTEEQSIWKSARAVDRSGLENRRT